MAEVITPDFSCTSQNVVPAYTSPYPDQETYWFKNLNGEAVCWNTGDVEAGAVALFSINERLLKWNEVSDVVRHHFRRMAAILIVAVAGARIARMTENKANAVAQKDAP